MKTKNTCKRSNLNKNNLIIKTLLIYLCYFLYVTVISDILLSLGNFDNTVIMFIADFVFLIGIVFLFKDKLKDDFVKVKKKYKLGQLIKKVLFWVTIILVFNILMGAITDAIYPNFSIDDNTIMLDSLFKISTLYTVFKTMIFAIIAEELLFRESFNKIVDNNILFVIITSIVYTILNVWLGSIIPMNLIEVVVYVSMFFLPAIIFSTAYIRNDRNIIIFMFIKFIYQLIPLTFLLLASL